MDKIILKNIKIYAYHGAIPEENKLGQNFYVDLELFLSLKEAGQTDDIYKSVSYAEIYIEVEKIVKKENYNLIETVAEKIANGILEKYKKIKNIKVQVRKPQAPINGYFDYVGVEIYR